MTCWRNAHISSLNGVQLAIEQPIRREMQPGDQRVRYWVFVPELDRYLRVVTLEDGVTVLWEADRHLDILTEALAEWNISPETTWQALESDRARVRIVDQLLYRLIKLQDTVGERHAGPQADPA